MREKDLADLRRQVQALEQQIVAVKATVERLSIAEAAPVAPAPAYVPPPAAAPAAPKLPRSAADVEINLVGVWFNRIAIVLLLAALYGFAWASDRGLIGPAAKIAVGFVAAALSVAAGYRTHTKGLRAWSLGITGLGAGLLFATDWAAFQLFALFPYGVAFALMVLFAAATVGLALYYDALPVAWLGAFGAYLTPFLLYTGSRNPVGLLAYTGIVSLAILALAAFRRWPSLNVLGFAASWLILGLSLLPFRLVTWEVHLSFATLFFLIWTGAAVLYGLVHRVHVHWRELTLVLVGGGLYLLAGIVILSTDGRAEREGALAFSMTFFYLLAAFGVVRARRTEDRLLPHVLLTAAGASLAAAIGLQFRDYWPGVAWAVEGAGLVWVGLRHRILMFRYEGLIVLVISAIAYLDQRGPAHYNLLFAIAIAAMGTAAWAYRRIAGADADERMVLGAITGVLAVLMSLLWIHDQTAAWAAAGCPVRGFCANRAGLQAAAAWLRSTLWAVAGFMLLAGGLGFRDRTLRLAGVAVIGLALGTVAVHDIWLLNGGWRVLGLFALGSLLLVASYLYFRFKDRLLSHENTTAGV